ncbi:hypothetical protein Syun_010314 [Stephania yunnanensis]|uniref:Uncharacterized protein n=1 Tax=Stephania yunnanensis TaxID=152371 RepID=A0AAP0PRN7_9MAGN
MLNNEGQRDSIDEIGTKHSPDELRQQAVEEKKRYKILKGENKPEEALRAFKRGKELERQAKALEIALRKSHKKALSSSSLASTKKMNDDGAESDVKINLPSQSHKEKDDLVSELRELGWSDADLHDADKKPVKMSLEGELSILLGEGSRKSIVDKGTAGIDKTQVFTLKRKALALKREGRLAEAKEELKKAKILEKQLEEQEFLAGAEDSDDELLALIQNIDDDKDDDPLPPRGKDAGFDFGHLLSGATDLGDDGHFDVTEEDMDDPEMAAALKSMGWTEDLDQQEVNAPQSVIVDVEAISNEILSLKKEAVNEKRAGNVAEALTLLRKAKILEKEVECLETRGNNFIASKAMIQKV